MNIACGLSLCKIGDCQYVFFPVSMCSFLSVCVASCQYVLLPVHFTSVFTQKGKKLSPCLPLQFINGFHSNLVLGRGAKIKILISFLIARMH